MNTLQDATVKETYDKCKYVVKLWENQFKKNSGRTPSKLDIREASKEVRNAYKTYFHLKTQALEESLMHIEGFDTDTVETTNTNLETKVEGTKTDIQLEAPVQTVVQELSTKINTKETWGIHLNKQESQTKAILKSEKSNVNLSYTQKLFQASRTSKRLPRKSLSFIRKKSELDISKSHSLSQPDSVLAESEISSQLEVDFELGNVKTVSASQPIYSQQINLLKTAFDSNSNSLRNLDKGWIKRITNNLLTNSPAEQNPTESDIESSKIDYDSDEIIDNSEDEEETSSNIYHTRKKRKILSTSVVENKQPMPTVDATSKRLDFSNIFDSNKDSKSETDICEFNEIVKEEESSKKSSRTKKTLANIYTEDSTENEDPFATDNDDDPEFNINHENEKRFSFLEDDEKIKTKKTTKTTKTRTKKIKKPEIKESTEEKSKTYELEYSIKPRIVTAPRIKDLKTVVASKIRKSKQQVDDANDLQKEKKLKQKIESGTLNDNFVQVNLKKKIFVRGKSNWSFNKYKKQQWKKKKNALYGPDMDMGGCDGGMLTCFKCGEVGHFARNCKTAKGDALLPQAEDEEEECPYPTLEEAAKLAKESVLAVKKPNFQQPSEETEPTSEDDEDLELLAEVERLEKDIQRIDIQTYIDSTTHVKPYYELTPDGSLIDTPQEVFETLRKFGHESFRAGQEQAIMRILSGKSTLVTLSTGSGKSLCYQLPAYLYSTREPCISLVISPLVSLMEDQVTGIPGFLKAACLHTNQTKTQRDKIMEAIALGNLNILLVSPEAVVAGEKSSGFGSLLRKLPPIAFACIDEAHCVSQWSHNFRPSYLKICHVLKDKLGVNTVIGLTATATRATSDSIIRHLSIPDGWDGIIKDIPLPNNLRLTISCDSQRDQALVALLLSDRFKECKSVIVYCTRREECQRIAAYLRTSLQSDGVASTYRNKRKRSNYQAEPYHAGMSASRRKSIQKAFMSGELRIVVATVAFGMGINKSDIRAVIHYNMPMSFESYVQEVGRAGRDGLPAHCHLFLDSQGRDENELCRHIYSNSTDRHVIRKLLQRCFVPCSCKISCPGHEVAFSIEETVRALDIPEENIETLLCYLELHNKNRIQLLSHAYISCKIISYGGHNVIRKAAKECPPLAMALALYQKENSKDDNVFQFPVIDAAAAMGWDSGICKHKLKNLEWILENHCPKRSKLSVQFSNLGFRLNSPGNLTETELDETLDQLYNKVKEQERTSLLQLQTIHTTLRSISNRSFKDCITLEKVNEKEELLKTKIREYFENPDPLESLPKVEAKPVEEEQIVADVRAIVCMYKDNYFTGRSIARIFYGIQSPNYPAVIWGRCKFWRAHLGTDFNTLCQIATREILRMR